MTIISKETFTEYSDPKRKGFNEYCEKSKGLAQIKKNGNSTTARKNRAYAKKINELRQEAIHIKGFNLDLIYPLSLENLKGLLKGNFKFNEYNELVSPV